MKTVALTTAVLALSFAIPQESYAATPSLFSVVANVGGLVIIATQLIASLAILYFFWGLASYVLNSGDEKKKEEGRNIMIWGTIALFVMVSIWGLVRAIQDTFDVDSNEQIGIPQVTVE